MSAHYTAKRLPRHPGPAAWNQLLPKAEAPRVLESDNSADIAIIGAGFAGLSAARRLMQLDPTLKVVILEASRVAEGPSGRNSGFMIDLPHDLSSDTYVGSASEKDQKETALNRYAIQFAKQIAEDYGMDRSIFDPCGKINAAASVKGDQHNIDYGSHLANMSEPHELLDSQQMAEITGIQFYRSGLYTPGTVILQPAGYIRTLADGLGPQITIYENSPVTKFKQSGDSWTISTNKANLSVSKIILANNGHAESFGFFKRRLMHIFTYASMTEPFDKDFVGGQPQWGVTPADPMGTTVRRIDTQQGSRIVVRSRFTYNPSMTVSDPALQNAGKLHDKKFAQRFPMLEKINMEYRWAGHLCISLNNVQAHGEVDNGIFSAVCQNGLGVAKGTLSGISAAELATGNQSETSVALCAMDPPKVLPPEPTLWIGAKATMHWKEWRAGKE